MRIRVAMGAALALLLAGCGHDRAARGGATITYATAACFGTCPVYSITLGPDGQGIFTGERFTAVTGERRFQASPDQVAAFTRSLAAYRPKGERLIQPGKAECKAMVTDQPGVDVRWQPALAPAAHLGVYYGCDGMRHRAMFDALRAAPNALPVAAFIGKS